MKLALVFISIIGLMLSIIPVGRVQVTQSGVCSGVYYHNGNRYSVIVDDNGSLSSKAFPSIQGLKIEILTDVKEGERMWYETKWYQSEWTGLHAMEDGYIRIHIHSIKDINTGGWTNGKFGRGTTVIIERD